MDPKLLSQFHFDPAAVRRAIAEPLYTGERTADAMTALLSGLSYLTSKEYSIHDFTLPIHGRAITDIHTLPPNPLKIEKLYAHSPREIRDGDLILTQTRGGDVIVQMAFDVKRYKTPDDLYRMHAIDNNPAAGIGHALPDWPPLRAPAGPARIGA